MKGYNFFTKEEFVALHRKLWDWLVKNPEEEKDDWPGWSRNGGYYDMDAVTNECWLCASTHRPNSGGFRFDCKRCPLQWPDRTCDYGGDSPFVIWGDSFTKIRERAKIARLIRDLPYKKKYQPKVKKG